MRLVVYISAHGFGHATRSIELLNAIGRKRPDAAIVVRTAVSPGFIRAAVETAVDLQFADVDTGVVQIDSLEPHEAATARVAGAFYADFDRRVETEAAVLRALQASLVVGDIPPLAFAAAARAGIRSVAVGNFTWDWIYEAFPAIARQAPHVLPTIRRAYGETTVTLRLPMHGGFAAMRRVEDIPIIARHSRVGREAARRSLGVPAAAVVVLASFGAYGARLDYAAIARENSFTLMLTDHEAPADGTWEGHRLLRLSERSLAERRLRYPDLVAAADVVVTKPGYGIVSECIANGPALLYTSRGRFPEYDVFVREMAALLPCRYITQDDLRGGQWSTGIDALLRQPRPRERVATTGAEIAADRILAEAEA